MISVESTTLSKISLKSADLQTRAETEDHIRLLGGPTGAVPVDGPGDGAPLPKMNDGVQEAGAADVAAAPRVVSEPVRPLRDVKQADIGPHGLAGLAHLVARYF